MQVYVLLLYFRFFVKISSFGFNSLSSKLVGMFIVFISIVLMFVLKDLISFGIALSRRYAAKCACAPEFPHICATKRRRAKYLATSTNMGSILRNIPTNFESKQFKLML